MTSPIQTTFNKINSSDTLVLTFTDPVTAGSTVVICLGGPDANSATPIITPGSGGDVFLEAVLVTSNQGAAIWYVLSSSGGYTTVTYNANQAGADGLVGWAYEMPAANALDQTSIDSGSSSSSFTSLASPETTQGTEYAIGIGVGGNSTTRTASGPSSPWTNLTAQTAEWVAIPQYIPGVSGYQFVTSEAQFTYSGTFNSSTSFWGACVATFKIAPPVPVIVIPSSLNTSVSFPAVTIEATPGGSPLFVSASFPAPEITAVSIYKFPAGVMDSKTEILLNGTWTDISDYVYQRDNTVIGRGRPNEATGIQAVSMTMTLNNRDGRFSPKNTLGAYYPFLARNIQLRLSVNPTSASGQTYSGYRFWGEVSVWPPSWDVTGRDIYCQIVVNGQIRRLQQGAAIGSALYRYYTKLTGNLVPVGYWPCQEGTGAQQFASPIPGVPPGTWTITPGLAQDNSFAGSDPLPQFIGSQWSFPSGISSTPSVSGTEFFGTPGTYQWVVPDGVSSITNVAVVGGGGGCSDINNVGGTDGGNSSLQVGLNFLVANAGTAGTLTVKGLGGTGSTAPIHYDGGSSVNGEYNGTDYIGAGGGSSGGSGSPGNPGHSNGPGGAAVTGGGPGGTGGTNSPGTAPPAGPGGGAGGVGDDSVDNATYGAGGGEWAGANSIAVIPGQIVNIVVGVAGTGSCNGFAGQVSFSWVSSLSGPTPSVNANYIRFLLDVPASGVAGTLDIVVTTVGTIAALNLLINYDGTINVVAFNQGLSQIINTGFVQSGVNGVPTIVSIEYVPDGNGNINWSVNTILPGPSQTVRTIFSGSVPGQVSLISEVIANVNGQETGNTGSGHYSMQYYADTLQNVAYAASGYAGELAATRFLRLCLEQGIGSKLVGNVNDTPQMGSQVDDTFINLLQSIENFDLGQVFETRDMFGLGYRTRVNLQNQVPVATYDYSQSQISPPLQPTEDDQLTRNDVTISRQVGQDTGSSALAFLASGPMSIQDPPNGVGDYTYANTVAAFADSQLLAIAQWIVIIGTVDDYRYPQITIDLTRSANVNAFIETADIDVGDFLEIVNPPSFLTSETIKQLAWGFTETINNYIWLFTFNAVPEAPYEGTGLPNWQIPLPANANNSGRARPPGLISPMAIEEMKE